MHHRKGRFYHDLLQHDPLIFLFGINAPPDKLTHSCSGGYSTAMRKHAYRRDHFRLAEALEA